MLLARDYSSNHFAKLGIDGGSFLKMSLAVIKVTDENDDEKRSLQLKSLHLLTSSTAQNTGVKRQLIVAIA